MHGPDWTCLSCPVYPLGSSQLSSLDEASMQRRMRNLLSDYIISAHAQCVIQDQKLIIIIIRILLDRKTNGVHNENC